MLSPLCIFPSSYFYLGQSPLGGIQP